MKIEINQRQLLHTVTVMSAVAGKTKAIQILDSVEFAVARGQITLRAVSSEATLKHRIECPTEGEGRFLVNCAQILKYLSTLPNQQLTIEVSEVEMNIKREKGGGTLPITSAESFPTTSIAEEPIELRLPADYLLSIVRDGSRFVGTEDLRPHLRHIYVSLKDGVMTGYATDTRVLYSNSYNIPDNDEAAFYINCAIFPILQKMLTAQDDCMVSISKTSVEISCGDYVLNYSVPADKYPNAARIIPKTSSFKMATATADMKACVNRVMAMADGKSKLVKMQVSMLDAVVSCNSTGYQSSANESFSCQCNGEVTIGYDGNYMTKALDSAGDNVTIGIDGPTLPMLFASDSEPGMKIVLMPMVINGV